MQHGGDGGEGRVEQPLGLRVGHGQHDGVGRLAVDLRPRRDGADVLLAHVEAGGQVLDQGAKPFGRRPAHRPRLGGEVAVVRDVEGVGPRAGQPAGVPVLGHHLERRIGDGEVGGTRVDDAVVGAPAGHPAADPLAAVEHDDVDARRPQGAGGRDPRDPGTDHDDAHRSIP